MIWTRENIAWLAGLFEGEGSLSCRRVQTEKRGHGRAPWALDVSMCNEDVLRRAHVISGVGNLHGPYDNGEGHKPYWKWTTTKRAHVFALLVALWPWLGERRRAKACEALRDLPPVGYPLRGRTWHEARE